MPDPSNGVDFPERCFTISGLFGCESSFELTLGGINDISHHDSTATLFPSPYCLPTVCSHSWRRVAFIWKRKQERGSLKK